MANLARARVLIEQGQFPQAREIVVEALHTNYDDLAAWQLLLDCARDRQEYGRTLREILRIDPENKEARALAVELAKATRGEGQQRRRRRSPLGTILRIVVNTFAFLIVIGIAGGVAYLYLQWQGDNNGSANSPTAIVPTLDALAKCQENVPLAYNRLTARCPLVQPGEACLINPAATVQSNTGRTDLLTLAGDDALLSNLQSLETFMYNPADFTFGMVMLRGLTSFEEDSGSSMLMVVTPGVQVRFFDEQLNQVTFSSNPTPSECPATPPAGLLVHVSGNESGAFEINDEPMLLSGTLFLQVDVAAGLRGIVIEGEVSLVNRERVVMQGEWFKVNVDATLLASPVPVEVFEAPPTVRGDLLQLLSLGQALDLNIANWQFPGIEIPTSESSAPPLTTAAPPGSNLPTTAPDIPTATPVPPDMITPDAAQ
ncbi:MAG: hypothetical protein L0154_18750 [Chloroflexi bacterium]|nr:hypothetical protein [Chloroflexota bacterium]